MPKDELSERRDRAAEAESRAELFEDVIVQLDSARMEAQQTDSKSVADYIEYTLVPFIEAERDRVMPTR